MMIWDKIMQNCPTMKSMIENKIQEELSKKNIEIEELKKDKESLQSQIDNLTLTILTKEGESNV